MKTYTDALGNGIAETDVVVATGLQNAGRSYTVLALSEATTGRAYLEEHLTGRKFWTFLRHYRADLS